MPNDHPQQHRCAEYPTTASRRRASRKRSAPLALAVVLVAAIAQACGGGGGGGGPTEPPPPPGPAVVTIEVMDNAFVPRAVQIEPGDTVRWVLRGSMTNHNVVALDGSFNSGFVFQNTGDVFERTFPASDNGRTFEYACSTHEVCCDMKASVRVGATAPPPEPGY